MIFLGDFLCGSVMSVPCTPTNIDNIIKFVQGLIEKGYAYSKLGNQVLVWSDGIALYDICGTCDFEILWQMAESLNQNTSR